MNGGQKGTDQHDEQVDFHVALRCALQLSAAMQRAFQSFRLPDGSGAIKNGKSGVTE
jgi:hypothetical protein